MEDTALQHVLEEGDIVRQCCLGSLTDFAGFCREAHPVGGTLLDSSAGC